MEGAYKPMTADDKEYSECMAEAMRRVMIALQDDIVSYAEFLQIVHEASEVVEGIIHISADYVLAKLLQEDVEIGHAELNAEQDRLKFIAWRGSIDDRIARVHHRRSAETKANAGYSSWLCLKSNIDTYEI